jgi:hypothetical protein
VKKACLLLLVVLLPMALDAQSFFHKRRNRHYTAFAGTGVATYFGELKDSRVDYFKARPNLELGLSSYFLDYFSVSGHVTFFSLEGADSLSSYESIQERNLSFRSRNMEIIVTGTVYALPMSTRFYQREKFNFYATAGVGAAWSNPRAKYQGEWYNLRKLKTELVDYQPFTIVLPMGIGVTYKIDAFFNVSVEGMYRYTFSDYLDDVSTQHTDLSNFTDPVAAALSDRRPEIGIGPATDGDVRGNPEKDDGYFLLNAKIEYFLAIGLGRARRKVGRRR